MKADPLANAIAEKLAIQHYYQPFRYDCRCGSHTMYQPVAEHTKVDRHCDCGENRRITLYRGSLVGLERIPAPTGKAVPLR